MANTELARDIAIRALDARHADQAEHDPGYWEGYLTSALEQVIGVLKAGA